MRREHILKICANHYITVDMEISYKEGNNKELSTLTWRANDFSDNESRIEQFSCRFKTPETAAAFKAGFEKGRAIVKSTEDASASVSVSESVSQYESVSADDSVTSQDGSEVSEKSSNQRMEQPSAGGATAVQGFGDKFKPKEG